MIGEEMTVDAHLVVRNREMFAYEADEEAKEVYVGVRDREPAPILLAFRPVQHATSRVGGTALAREAPALLLMHCAHASSRTSLSLGCLEAALRNARSENAALIVIEVDVLHPATDRRARHT